MLQTIKVCVDVDAKTFVMMNIINKMKKNKKRKIRKDDTGEFCYQEYFVKGKMKLQKIYVIEGIPVDEFYENNADDITLLQNGDNELLYARELERNSQL